MTPVEVRVPTILRPHVGGVSTLAAEGATIGELFDGLVARYPGLRGQLVTEAGDPPGHYCLVLEGRDGCFSGADFTITP